jgi:uncharacterized iron-regulated membrane protein
MNGPVSEARRRKPLLSPSWVSAVLAGHSALGLAFAALIYLVCLSGTVTVFVQELQRWEQPSGPRVETVMPEAITRGIDAIRQKAPVAAKNAISIGLPSAGNARFTLSAGGREGGGGVTWLADAEGRPEVRVQRPVSDFIAALHTGLLLPRGIGGTLVGLTGIAMLALLISGVLAHPRMFKDAFSFRWGGSRRLQEADLHNRIGTWGLPFHFTIALTGAILGLFFLIFGGLAATAYKGDMQHAFADMMGPRGAENRQPAAIPPFAPIIASVRADAPSAVIRSVAIQHPGTRGQLISVMVQEPGRLSLFERYAFDFRGHLTRTPSTDHKSLPRQIIGAIQPLHFGWFGGMAIKIGYGLLGLSLCVVTSSGVNIWLARRRDKGRPAPTWERIWTATVWGQAAAFASAAILSLLSNGAVNAGTVWAAATAIVYASACLLRNDRTFRFGLRAVAAALLVILAIVHAGMFLIDMNDSAGWVVDAVLIGSATLIAAPILRRR